MDIIDKWFVNFMSNNVGFTYLCVSIFNIVLRLMLYLISIDEPSPCGQPNVVDWGKDFADLTWTPPESDGGAEITHYVIEMKEKNMGQWVEGKSLTVKEVQELGGMIKGKQTGLVEGCEYQFRVRAVNKGGPSKPSPPSIPMIAKTRFCEFN